MTRRELKTSNGVLMRRVILIGPAAMMLSAGACSHNTRDPILLTTPAETAFCARYFDPDHPPVWIYESDSAPEKSEKTDLLILWEQECAIMRGI